jgi:hypothetical protein
MPRSNHADLRRADGIPCPHFDTPGENGEINQLKSDVSNLDGHLLIPKRLLQ